MLALDHQAAADELLRVCRPGGTIGLIYWTPAGFVGQLFAAMKPYAPPPPPGGRRAGQALSLIPQPDTPITRDEPGLGDAELSRYYCTSLGVDGVQLLEHCAGFACGAQPNH